MEYTSSAKPLLRNSKLAVTLLFLICVTLTLTGWYYVKNRLSESHTRYFNALSAKVEQRITSRLKEYSHALYGSRGVFAANGQVTRNEWKMYVDSRQIDREFPAMRGLGFVRRVPRESLQTFLAEEQRGGFQFQLQSDGGFNELLIITFLEPSSRNSASLGYDIASSPAQKAAAMHAMEADEPTLTKRIQLTPETGGKAAFLFLLPVFPPGVTPHTAEERIASAIGWVYAPLTINELVAGVREDAEQLIDLTIYDGEESAAAVLYSTGNGDEQSRLSQTKRLDVNGQTWLVHFRSRPELTDGADRVIAAGALLAGLGVSILLAMVVWTLARTNETALLMAQQMTDDLLHAREDALLILERVQQSELKLAEAQRVAHVGSWEYDVATGEIIWSDEMFRILGFIPSEKVPPLNEVIKRYHPDDLPLRNKHHLEMIELGTPCEYDIRLLGLDDSVRWVHVIGKPICEENGRTGKLIGTMMDVTVRKQNEELASRYADELVAHNETLERATAFKSQFLANMSHEIRTPLTSIIGFTETLLTDEMSGAERSDALETVLKNGRHLLGIINDILDLSKIEAGKLETESLPVHLFELLTDVDNLMQHRAMEQGIYFGIEYSFPLPRTVQSDPTRIKQILFNLVGNAIKFTRNGRVTVTVSFDAGRELLIFDITDTGLGMTPEQRSRLFQAFSQGDTSTTRRFGGTGLGLLISHQLTQKLGGTISVDSTLGEGSTFTVTVATGPVPGELLADRKEVSQPAESIDFSQQRVPALLGNVLLVEDGPDNQRYISFLLKKAGVEFRMVENGKLAVEAAERESFDLILMDMQMPVMDGYTATRTIRDRGYAVPIVALTANTMISDVEKCINAGCTSFLGKPFERKELYIILSQFLNSRTEDPSMAIVPLLEEDDDADLIEVVLGIVDNFPVRIRDLAEAAARGDWKKVSEHSHSMRGIAGFYPQLLGITERISKAGKQIDPEAMQAGVKELEDFGCQIQVGREAIVERLAAARRSSAEASAS